MLYLSHAETPRRPRSALLGLLLLLALPASADLIISEVVDATLAGGNPKFVEITNTGATDFTFAASDSGIVVQSNSGTDQNIDVDLSGVTITAGQSYVIQSSANSGLSVFESTYGFAADLYTSAFFGNGDDRYILVDNGTNLDIYGEIDTDGTGEVWEYIDGYAFRNSDVTSGNAGVFDASEWTFSGANGLETGNDATEEPLIVAETSPGEHEFDDGGASDLPPSVNSTTPADSDTDVALDATIEITFSEAVSVTVGSWFDIDCTSSGNNLAAGESSTGDTLFTLTPVSDFTNGEHCTVTVLAAQVQDQDGTADLMESDYSFSFDVIAAASGGLVINEILADPAGDLSGDANGDGSRDSSQDEFVEIVNNSGSAIDISGWSLSDSFGLRHTFPASTIIPDQCAIVVFGGNTPTGSFGGATVQTASTGSLGMNNGGDSVILADDGATTQAEYSYGSEGGNNQSLTRDPDITGSDPLIQHSGATGAAGALFSPGTQIDGTSFSGCPNSGIAEDFESTCLPDGWTVFSVDSDTGNSWFCDSFSGDNFMEVNAFGNSAAADDWLISPQVAISSGDVVSFQNTKNFNDDTHPQPLTLLYSTDYAGSGDPSSASWTELTGVNRSTGGYSEVSSGEIDLSALAGQSLYIALQYQSSGTDSGSSELWQIDDFYVGPAMGSSASEVKIHEIQGSTNLADGTLVGTTGAADESPLLGQSVRVQGVVTQLLSDLGGFYVQEEDADADGDAFSSEGIFVASGHSVATGDLVTVEGSVAEVEGESRINASSVTVDSSGNALPAPIMLSFPTATVLLDTDGDFVANLEAYEGMLVTIPEPLSVTELFQLDRFGTIRVSSEGRLEQFTQNSVGDAAGYTQHLKDIAARSLIIDDGQDAQNANPIQVPELGGDGTLDNGDTFRMGDEYTNLSGVISFSEDDQTGSESPEYRIHLPSGTLTQANPRPLGVDDVGSDFKIAAFNVLNFFTTLDEFPSVGEGSGPNGLDPRGADANPQNASPTPGPTDEYYRQLSKLAAALAEIDADVVGLIELENDFMTGGTAPFGTGTVIGSGVAIQELVDEINLLAGSGTYDWVDPGSEFVGGDAIAVGFIYKPSTVEQVGTAAILDSAAFLDPNSSGSNRNRAALAQSFRELATDGVFTAAVNHFKSKGDSGLDSSCGVPSSNPDCDQGDGQGYWNSTRTGAAIALANWLASDPTNSGDPDVVILGDLNAYAMEDPIQALVALGYSDLAMQFLGYGAYSFVFDGQIGTLDYALANMSLISQVSGVTEWHINADEADALDYNLEFGRNPALLSNDPFRASDHDPVIIGLDLSATIVGTSGGDGLTGTSGNEQIIGGTGRDAITTGGGNDSIVFNHSSEFGDVITDFEVGMDLIDVSGAFDDSGVNSADPISDGILLFRERRGTTYLMFDPDGPGGQRPRTICRMNGVSASDAANLANFIY